MNFLKLFKNIYKNVIEENEENNILYYVAGSEDLPAPFGPEEEEEYIKDLMKGDNNARQKLVEHNLRLVVYIAKKFDNSNVGIEDLISIGTIGLMKAINTFKADKNIKLATYASRCIENEILMYLRKTVKIKGEISFDEPLNKDCDGNELLLSDVLGTMEDNASQRMEDDVDKKLLRISISKLTKKEKEIMQLRFGLEGEKEKTQKEVADLLGISQSYISRLEKKIIGKMKKEIMSKTG